MVKNSILRSFFTGTDHRILYSTGILVIRRSIFGEKIRSFYFCNVEHSSHGTFSMTPPIGGLWSAVGTLTGQTEG